MTIQPQTVDSASHHTQLDTFARTFQAEADLQRTMISLLSKMGCEEPRIHHGPLEKGKDIVFYGRSGLGEKALFACVVKNQRIVGDVTSHVSAKNVLFQAEQAFDETYVNPNTGTSERVKGVYVISPYECSASAITSIQERLSRSGRVEFFCGIRLIELFSRYWPAFLLFESDVLVSYLSTVKSSIESDNPIVELILRRSILAELPNTFHGMYVTQRFSFDFARVSIPPDLKQPVTPIKKTLSRAELSSLETQILTLDGIKSYLLGCSTLQTTLSVDDNVLLSYFEGLLARSNSATESKRSAKTLRERSKHSGLRGLSTKSMEDISPLNTASNPLLLEAAAQQVQTEIVDLLIRDCENANSAPVAARPASMLEWISSPSRNSYMRLCDLSRNVPGSIKFEGPSKSIVLESILDLNVPIVLATAATGFGKTSFCKWSVLQDADRLLQGQHTFLPVYFSLHRFAHKSTLTAEDSFFNSPELKKLVRDIHRPLQIRLYLDGLDEIADEAQRGHVCMLARDLVDLYPGTRVVITSRDHVAGPYLDGILRIRVDELDLQQQRMLVYKWLGHEAAVDEFFVHLNSVPSLHSLLKVPLLATLIAAVYKKQRTLPSNRTALYTLFVELLSGGWDFVRGINRGHKFGQSEKLIILSRFAGINQIRKRRGATIDDFRRAVRESLSGLTDVANEIFDELLQDGLLVNSGAGVQFSHLSFQEFFAAKDLSDPSGAKPRKILKRFLNGDDWWKEVLLFYITITGKPAEMERWIQTEVQQIRLTTRSHAADVETRMSELVFALSSAFPGHNPRKYRTLAAKSRLTAAGRKKLSDAMKARWAARRRSFAARKSS